MATFQKRGNRWRAIIRRKGSDSLSKTFPNKALAESWARSVEFKIDGGDAIQRSETYLHEIFTRYSEEVSETKKGVRWEQVRPEGLHFHDTRREALTRMSKKVPVEVLAKISGHKTLGILLNVYYAPSPEDLADALG